MSYAPASILAARSYLAAQTGLSLNALGIVGDVAHGNAGYHVGWDRLVNGLGRGDYSVSHSGRDANPTNAAMALDIGSFDGLRELSLWIVQQCKAGAPDAADIREVIYTPDGFSVARFDRMGRLSGGDDSHLFHTHISYFRDSEGRDKTALFRRFFEGEDMSADSDAILLALVDGLTKVRLSDGKDHVVSPTGWQIANEKRFAAIEKDLDALGAQIEVGGVGDPVAIANVLKPVIADMVAKAVAVELSKRLAA